MKNKHVLGFRNGILIDAKTEKAYAELIQMFHYSGKPFVKIRKRDL